jgi:PTS system mannose-specific IIA component
VTGIIIITHGRLARELLGAAEFILGKIEQVECISVGPELEPRRLRDNLAGAIGRMDQGQGVLILTDMFGGTPNNISLAFLSEGKVEVVTGVNLPMLIKAATSRQNQPLGELASLVREAGKGSISVAGEILSS